MDLHRGIEARAPRLHQRAGGLVVPTLALADSAAALGNQASGNEVGKPGAVRARRSSARERRVDDEAVQLITLWIRADLEKRTSTTLHPTVQEQRP